MKIICLKNFIKTAKFDQLEVGVSTKQDVIHLMGDDFDFGDFGKSQIIKYGWYEFFYWTKNEKIFAIQHDHLLIDSSGNYTNDYVSIDSWFLDANKIFTLGEITKILKNEHIEYKLEKQNFKDAIAYIRLSNGITIDFDEFDMQDRLIEDPAQYMLNGIRLFKL